MKNSNLFITDDSVLGLYVEALFYEPIMIKELNV